MGHLNAAEPPAPDKAAIKQAKQVIRDEMIRRRGELSGAECRAAAENLRRRLVELLHFLAPELDSRDRPLRLGVYSAIRQEADLAPAWDDLLAWPAELYFPAVMGSGQQARLVFGRLPANCRPADFLVPGRFGIDEPPAAAWLLEPPELDVVFLPGLAFDRQGNRLGWGKAFYDRLIATLPGNPILAGVCYPFQILPAGLPAEPTDQPVSWLLTPDYFIAAEKGPETERLPEKRK